MIGFGETIMGMGIVSDKEFDSEFTHLNPDARNKMIKDKESNSSDSSNSINESVTGEIIDAPTRGRGKNNFEVPDGLRKLIGEESAINGRQAGVELAQSLGISPSSVSAYDVGATSTSTYDERPNESHINNSKARVAKKARGKLLGALRHITKDKLESSSAKDLAGVAKDMAAVIKVMEPEQPKAVVNDNGPKFVFYAPQFKKEMNYEVVQAKE